jgi:hypothetical protein
MHPDVYDTLLEIAIEDPEKRERNERVWRALSNLNGEIIKPMQNPQNPGERLAKSEVVQHLATAFTAAFTDVCGVENATLYCHMTLDHLPEMVRDTPVDLSEVSQQALEHALKQGKSDMRDFTNKRLRSENMGLGRNQQVMAKERERVHLEQEVAMPLSRNVKRQLGDGSKEVEKQVERAGRKGLLTSRSQMQIDKKVEKSRGVLEGLREEVREYRLTLPLPAVPEEAPLADEEAPPEPPLSDGLHVPLISLPNVPGDTTVLSPSTSVARDRSGARGRGTGRGAAGRGRGGAGTGRAGGQPMVGGRRVPKTARAI